MDEKNDVKPCVTEASAPPTRVPHAGGGGAQAGEGKRFSATRKLVADQRLIRGKNPESLSRDCTCQPIGSRNG